MFNKLGVIAISLCVAGVLQAETSEPRPSGSGQDPKFDSIQLQRRAELRKQPGNVSDGIVVRESNLPQGATRLLTELGSPKFAPPIDKGQHVLIMGNSFQVFVDHHLNTMASAADIKGHVRGGDPLAAVKVDVVASNPWFRIHDKADKSLDDLTERALKHNPNIRVLAQVGWLPYDDPIFPEPEKGRAKTDWNARSMKDVRAIHAAYRKNASEQVRALNKKHGKQVVYIVPVAQAVMALREKIAAGEAAGLKSQDDLFSDSIGHARPPLELLNAYCHFAVVYRRTPVGLEIKGAKDQKLHRLLQQIAWDAAVEEPLSGVTLP